MKQYPLAKPYIGDEEIVAVADVLKSGVLSLGPNVQAFERAFAENIGARYACAVSSGTAGLHLAMIAAGIGPLDEVITTPFSFVASANSIVYVGARPVFVDIDPVTYNMDPAKIEERMTKKTKAILVVHIFGQPCDMDPILHVAKKYQLTVIEDACESIGSTYNGRQAGTFGASAVFAFYPNKQMTTGEGGMIVTNDEATYRHCKALSNQGRSDTMQWLDHRYLGYNYRLDEMSAAVGLVQLRKLDFLIAERQKISGWYTACLEPFPQLVTVPRVGEGNTHTWFVYPVKLAPAVSRDRVMQELALLGIHSKPYLPSIHLFDFYAQMLHTSPGDFPESEAASARCLALPFYIGLSEDEVKYISDALIRILTQYVQ